MTAPLQLAKLPTADDKAELLETLERLREDIESGRVVAFGAVGVTETDETLGYSGSLKRVSRLRLMGAVAHYQACLHAGEA